MRPLRAFRRTGIAGLALATSVAYAVTFAGSAAAAPTSDFTFDVAAPIAAEPVVFTFTGSCDVEPCRVMWRWFQTGGTHLGTTMGEGLVLTYAFPAAGTYDVVARITNGTSTHGSAISTHALVVSPAVSQVTVPSVPQTVTAVSSAPNSVTVGWVAPASTGGAEITGYRVTVLDGNPLSVAEVAGTARSATLSGVAAGTVDVEVVATNSAGGSPAGATTVTVANVVPPTPTPTPTPTPPIPTVTPTPPAPSVTPTPPAPSVTPTPPPPSVTPTTPAPTTTPHLTPSTVPTSPSPTTTPTANAPSDSSGSSSRLAPAAPTTPRVAKVTRGGITTVSWGNARRSARAAVTRFVVTVDGRTRVLPGTAHALLVRGLREGPALVTVRAANRYGMSRAAISRIVVPRAVAKAAAPTLKLGATGPAVTRLQVALRMPAPDGVFGASTRRAVLVFQAGRGLHRSGEADDRMRYLLAV